MSETKHEEIHELAGGWITERKHTPIPTFLKLAYVGFCVFGVAYLYSYWAGETGHDTRGPLVQQFNAIAETPAGLWFGVILVCVLAFVAGLLWFVFSPKAGESE